MNPNRMGMGLLQDEESGKPGVCDWEDRAGSFFFLKIFE